MNAKGMKVIITGATGMVGEGVLDICLKNNQVDEILIINRKSVGFQHPKLKEIIHSDFFDFHSLENELSGYDACFFCLGVSSIGKSKEEYYKLTYTLTLNFAEILSTLNSNMTFCYVSGQGTDSNEKSKSHWAVVKGKTENELMKLPFKQVFAYRPGFIKPIRGLKNAHSFYKYINWLFPLGKKLFPAGFNSLEEIGLSMVNVSVSGYSSKVLNGKDISLTAGYKL